MKLFRQIFLSFILCFCVWLAGLAWFITQIPQAENRNAPTADAIVVLTGGSGRMEYGLQLLAEGKGKKLFISGVGKSLTLDNVLRHATPAVREKLAGRESDIVLGHEAENTIGNAAETAQWLKQEQFKSIRLVTANYHMPRSTEEFEEVLDNVVIIPSPVFPDELTLSSWWLNPESRVLVLVEYHKFLAAKLRHLFVSITHRA